MSINISSKIMDVATKLELELDPGKLGPRQLSTLKHMCRTGYISQKGGLLSMLASAFIDVNKKPYIDTTWGGIA